MADARHFDLGKGPAMAVAAKVNLKAGPARANVFEHLPTSTSSD